LLPNETVFAEVTVLSHRAMSVLTGVTPLVQLEARFRLSELLALTMVPA
jgi:hypothetical protein